MTKEITIYLFQIISIFQIFLLFKCEEIDQIDKCVEYVYAPSTFSQYLYDQLLCIECEIDYIVSKNLKSCIDFRYQLSHLQYANCKRLAQDGQCAEAVDGIQLLPNNQYTIVKDQKFFERCAIVNESETECLFPRFGFILDITTKNIYKDTFNTFCALFNQKLNQCQQFQQRFNSQFQQQQGVYLGEDFISPDKLQIFNGFKLCQIGFAYIESNGDQLEGCFLLQQGNSYNQLECQIGYASNDEKSQCSVIIPFCQEYFEIQGKQLCSKCIPFYKLHLQNCIEMIGCLTLSKTNPNKCLKCNNERILLNNECILKNEKNRFNQQNSQNESNQQSYLNHSFNQNQNDKNEIDSKNSLEEFKNKSLIVQDNFQKNGGSKPFLLRQPLDRFDKNDIEDQQCVFDSEMVCVYCRQNALYYVDEDKNNCIFRKRSVNCEDQILNSDDCFSLKCSNDSAINENLMENFDLKNVMVLKYLKHLSENFKGSDYFMTDLEKQQLNKKYMFYGINFLKKDQICVKYSDQLQKGVNLYYIKNNYYIICQERILNIFNIQEFPYLAFKCLTKVNINNNQFEKCTLYNNDHSFCLECDKGFYFNSKTLRCEQNISNCIIHSKQNNCILCQSGYKLVNGTHCEAICGIVVPGSINKFHSFYIYQKPDSNYTICKETQKPCRQFVNDQCIECFQGYYLDYSSDYNCLIDSKFPDCKIVDKVKFVEQTDYIYQGKQCIQCQDGYVLFRGLCFCQTQKCMKYIYCDEKKCLKKFRSQFIGQLNLGSNQYLEKHGNLYKVLDCVIENCLVCHEGNICLKCKFGFYQVQNKQACQAGKDDSQIDKIQKNCLILSQDKKNCIQCQPNYFLRKDLKCYKKCDSYQKIFMDSELGNFCFECPIGCKGCTFNQNYFIQQKQLDCQSCEQNYFYYTETLQCKKICVFYQLNEHICVRQCIQQYYQLGNKCVEKCPLFYKIEDNNSKICIESCQGLYRYDDNPQYCTAKCELNYLTDEQNLLCRKCLIDNCLICSKYQNNICNKCHQGYVFYEGKCVFFCKNSNMVSNKDECEQNITINRCIEQKQGQCIKCISNSLYNQKHNRCDCIGFHEYVHHLNACKKQCGENCQICNQQGDKCLKCYPNKYLLDGQFYGINQCYDQCPIGYYQSIKNGDPIFKQCIQCPINCFSCENQFSCTECSYPFKEYFCNGILICLCDNSSECKTIAQKYVIQQQKNKCCLIINCSKCEQNINNCEKCNNLYPYLYLNTCLQSCPEGTFSNENNQCEQCNPLCKTCTNKSSKSCLSCKLSIHMVESDNTCRCKNQKVFFQNQCYTECPRFTKLLNDYDRICQEYCLDHHSYPVFDDDGVFERCENNFSQLDSKFCEQNLINIEKIITFQIDCNDSTNSQRVL
ncbi:hypothetical protein ABPG73_005409 [Tetrahymena malaccensis]